MRKTCFDPHIRPGYNQRPGQKSLIHVKANRRAVAGCHLNSATQLGTECGELLMILTIIFLRCPLPLRQVVHVTANSLTS
jgi:hypothetical protein